MLALSLLCFLPFSLPCNLSFNAGCGVLSFKKETTPINSSLVICADKGWQKGERFFFSYHPMIRTQSFFFSFKKFFWPYHACGILVPQPGIKPTPPAVETQSLNHRTAREVLGFGLLVHLCLWTVNITHDSQFPAYSSSRAGWLEWALELGISLLSHGRL